jgi:tetraprenyl-beta-curcumene synthase
MEECEVTIPTTSWSLMIQIYKKVIPEVYTCLDEWRKRAKEIPDPELREQALASIANKAFHCEGGAVYALLAGDHLKEAVKFIVAYQTISDYLDNLCDRSTSLDPNDFSALHMAMSDALTVNAPLHDYYHYRSEKDDGGYLSELVKTCQTCILSFPAYKEVEAQNLQLASLYSDLQVNKHVHHENRETRLIDWFEQHKAQVAPMTWYEFSACTGSTLGIFCLSSYAAGDASFSKKEAELVKDGYFPWVQGLHIMMDYFIDQEEDRIEGDLNFCFYYESDETLLSRMEQFFMKADDSLKTLRDNKFHRLINNGLLAIYLADEKVKKDANLKRNKRRLMRHGGMTTLLFYSFIKFNLKTARREKATAS